MWTVCKTAPVIPPAFAGWSYFAVEDLDEHADGQVYQIVGWRFLAYGGRFTIRVTPGFFKEIPSEKTFVITSAE
jgi:hypothetical protein